MAKRQRLIPLIVLLLLAGGAGTTLVAYNQALEIMHHPVSARDFDSESGYDPLLRLHALGATAARETRITSADGLELEAYYVPSQNRAAVLVVHGYKDPLTEMIPIAAMLAGHGYGVLLPQLRAHGKSDGERITFGRDEVYDLAAGHAFLQHQTDVDADRIGIFGNSMGGAIAVLYAAQNPEIKAVAAQSPYASFDDTIEISVKKFTGLPPFPFAPLILFFLERELGFPVREVAPERAIAAIAPRGVMVMMGGSDTYVNPRGGELLADSGGDGVEFWFEPALDHVEFDKKLPQEFEKRVTDFFTRHLISPESNLDAESLYLFAEQTLFSAPGFTVDFHITSEGVVESDLTGAARIGSPDIVEISASGSFASHPVTLDLAGSETGLRGGNGEKTFAMPLPEALREALVFGFTRMGLLHNLARLSGCSPPDHATGEVRDWVRVSRFVPAEPKVIQGVETAGVRFSLTVNGQPSGEAVLWVHPETGLPLERSQTVQFSTGEMRVVERYTNLRLNPERREVAGE